MPIGGRRKRRGIIDGIGRVYFNPITRPIKLRNMDCITLEKKELLTESASLRHDLSAVYSGVYSTPDALERKDDIKFNETGFAFRAEAESIDGELYCIMEAWYRTIIDAAPGRDVTRCPPRF